MHFTCRSRPREVQCNQPAEMEEQDRSSKRRKHENSADSAGMVTAAQAFLTRTPLSAVARPDQKLTVLEHSDTVARAMQVHAAASASGTAHWAVPAPSTLCTHSGACAETRRDSAASLSTCGPLVDQP